MKTDLYKEYLLLGLLALLWGASYPLIKISVATIPPLTLVSIRVGIACIFLLLLCIVQNQFKPMKLHTLGKLFIQSCLNCIVPWTLLAWGQQSVDSSLAAILNSTTPIFVFLATYFWIKHEASSAMKGMAAVIGLIGVIIILGIEAVENLGQNLIAQLAIVAVSVSYAGAAIFGKSFKELTPLATAFGTLFIASIVMIPLSAIIEQPWNLTPAPSSIAAASILGLFSTGLALIIYFRLLKTLGSAGATSVSYLRTIVAVMIGTMLLDEVITTSVVFGIALIMTAVILLTRRQTR